MMEFDTLILQESVGAGQHGMVVRHSRLARCKAAQGILWTSNVFNFFFGCSLKKKMFNFLDVQNSLGDPYWRH